MDLLWRKELAYSKLLGKKPSSKNRIILEGLYDKLFLDQMTDSNEYHIQYHDPLPNTSNKERVIKSVSISIGAKDTPTTMGVVDMDADISGEILKQSIEKYSSLQNISPDILEIYIRDSRTKSCVFSLINTLTGDDWTWLKNISSELYLPKKWLDDEVWLLVLKLSRFRSSIHAVRQRGEKRPKSVPKKAFYSTTKSTCDFTFYSWLDLFLEINNNFSGQIINDHCLEATICDWIISERGDPILSESELQKQVKLVLHSSLINEIKAKDVTIEKLLNYVGNPFVDN
jgi:hypothetical protein